jgi:hypothetical protein
MVLHTRSDEGCAAGARPLRYNTPAKKHPQRKFGAAMRLKS